VVAAAFANVTDDSTDRLDRGSSPGGRLGRASRTAFAFLDATASLGHMIELYAREEGLENFYAMVRDAAKGWDGADPVRPLEI